MKKREEEEKGKDPLILEKLIALSEEDYCNFQKKLLPGTQNILGVRLPQLRKMAKAMAKDNWRYAYECVGDVYFEEIMLKGMIVGYAKDTVPAIWEGIIDYVPCIDNWSQCDSFVAGLKIVGKNQAVFWELVQPYFESERPFEVRFALVIVLWYYLEEQRLPSIFNILDKIKNGNYYVKMAVAWVVSIAYVRYPEKTMYYLKNNALDTFTFNKALQKIVESKIPTQGAKQIIRGMKR